MEFLKYENQDNNLETVSSLSCSKTINSMFYFIFGKNTFLAGGEKAKCFPGMNSLNIGHFCTSMSMG